MELKKANTQVRTVSEIEQFCKVLWKFNLIIAYPLTDSMLESWINNLLRLQPEITIEQLDEVMDKFITGEVEFFPNKGLTNIFLALNKNKKKFDIKDYTD